MSSDHIQMWKLNHTEDWVSKNWCFWIAVLEKILMSPLDCKEFKPVNPKGNKFWIFTGKADAKAEAPVLWPPDARSQFIGKDPDSGKIWDKRRRGWQWTRYFDTIINSMNLHLSKLWEMVRDREDWHAAVHGVTKSWTWFSDWKITA